MIKFNLCSHPGPQIPCRNGAKAFACITVPGVKAASTGKDLKVEQLEPNIPSKGFRLMYEEGEICEVTKIPRRTIIKLPCSHEADYSQQNFHPKQAWEGKNKEICHYFVEFPPSKFGCPSESMTASHISVGTVTTPSGHRGTTADYVPPVPEILAITGCQDSDPARTTSGCHFAGKIKLVLHGINFHALCSSTDAGTPSLSISSLCVDSFEEQFSVRVGKVKCSHIALVSQYQINCTVEKAAGTNLDVLISRKSSSLEGADEKGDGVGEGHVEEVAAIRSAVSFKERVNYRERFGKFVEMGVGGMKREISELYRRAFASRGKGCRWW